MKKIILSLAIAMTSYCSYAQNTYPWSATGNVGIGTSSPSYTLDVIGIIGLHDSTHPAPNTTFDATLSHSASSPYRILDITSLGGTGAWRGAINLNVNYNAGTPVTALTARANSDGITANVGIGTTTPQFLLDARVITGAAAVSVRSSDATSLQQFVAGANDGTAPTIHELAFNSSAPSTSFGLNRAGMATLYADGSNLTSLAIGTTGSTPFVFGTSNIERMRILSNGNILIGKSMQTNSVYKLDVNGRARFNEVVVNSTGADFVFEKKYKLTKLSEIKTYIDENHHLPEIPSANEMQKNGLNVGEMNTKLLQKVEELTLYLIEKDKQISNQQQRIEAQQTQINELKEQLKTIIKSSPKN